MNWMHSFILISVGCIIILIIIQRIRKKITLREIANISTIYGVIVGVILVFNFSPQLVKVQIKDDLKISSAFAAKSLLLCNFENNSGDLEHFEPYFLTTPVAQFELYIHNNGNAVASDYALDFFNTCPKEIRSGLLGVLDVLEDFIHWTAYCFINEPIPPSEKLEWKVGSKGNIKIHAILRKDIKRIILPPIKPGSYVGLSVGYWYSGNKKVQQFINHLENNKLSIRLVKLHNVIPYRQSHDSKDGENFETIELSTLNWESRPFPRN